MVCTFLVSICFNSEKLTLTLSFTVAGTKSALAHITTLFRTFVALLARRVSCLVKAGSVMSLLSPSGMVVIARKTAKTRSFPTTLSVNRPSLIQYKEAVAPLEFPPSSLLGLQRLQVSGLRSCWSSKELRVDSISCCLYILSAHIGSAVLEHISWAKQIFLTN